MCMLCAAAQAQAQETSPQERAALILFQEAKQLFDQGKYDKARGNLERARPLVKQALARTAITYYLARTYTQLSRCDDALPLLVELEGKLVDSLASGEEHRAAAERTCRLARARDRLTAFRCADALSDLASVDVAELKGVERRDAARMRSLAERCVREFDTRDEAGQHAARLHAEARAALAAGEDQRAAELAAESFNARASEPAAFVKGAALARLDRCGLALRTLGRVTDRSPDYPAAHQHETTCLVALARAAVAEKNCRDALAYLTRLDGRLKGRDKRWRAEKLAWCRPRATDFMTDTATRRAAYELYRAGKTAEEKGAVKQAVALYREAIQISDESEIRRRLGRLQLAQGGCSAATGTWQAVPRAHRTPADTARLQACIQYGPGVPVADLTRYVTTVSEALEHVAQGEFGDAADALEGPVRDGRNGALAAVRADALFRAGRCQAFLRASAVARALGGQVPEQAARLEQCAPASDPVAAKPAPEPVPSTAREPSPTVHAKSNARGAWGWVTLGVGVAALGGATYFGVRYFTDEPSGDTAEEWDQNAAELADRAQGWSIGAYALGGVGVVAVVTGIVLLAGDGDSDSDNLDAPGLSWWPVVQPAGLGVWGRF